MEWPSGHGCPQSSFSLLDLLLVQAPGSRARSDRVRRQVHQMSRRVDERPNGISGIAPGRTVRQQQPVAIPHDRPIEETPGLRSLRPGAIWAFLRKQPPSYWGVLTYLFFEYVRPQNLYESLMGPPYARIVVVLTLGAFVMERRKIRFGAPEVLLALFSLVVVASSIAAFYPNMSWDKLSVYFSWVIIYLIISNGVDTEERFLVFMLCFLLYSFKMSQFGTRSWAQDGFVFRDWGTLGAPGFFRNSGEFGIQMCIFLPLMVAFIQALGDNWSRW